MIHKWEAKRTWRIEATESDRFSEVFPSHLSPDAQHWTQCSCCCSYTSCYALLSSAPSLSSTHIRLVMGLTLNFHHTYWYNADISRSSCAFETRLLWADSLSRPFHKVHAEQVNAGTNRYRQQIVFVRKYNKKITIEMVETWADSMVTHWWIKQPELWMSSVKNLLFCSQLAHYLNGLGGMEAGRGSTEQLWTPQPQSCSASLHQGFVIVCDLIGHSIWDGITQ